MKGGQTLRSRANNLSNKILARTTYTKRGQTLKAGRIIYQTKFSPHSPHETRAKVKSRTNNLSNKIYVNKICVWLWRIGNMGFHLNKVVFFSINVELLTLKVCFIFQNYCWPLCCGERHLFVTFFNQQGIKGVCFCSFQLLMTLKNNVFCIFSSVIGQ